MGQSTSSKSINSSAKTGHLHQEYTVICMNITKEYDMSSFSEQNSRSFVYPICKTEDECERTLQTPQNDNIILISLGAVKKEFIQKVHDLVQLKIVFILCKPEDGNLEWQRAFKKVQWYTNINRLLKDIETILNTTLNLLPVTKFMDFYSKVFQKQCLSLANTKEFVVLGSREHYPLLPQAFKGIRQIGVIGWSSQGSAQAQNLRDSLAGSNIIVKVGLRENSSSSIAAERAGFTKRNGTLGEMYQVISESDLVLLLISDAAQAEVYKSIFAALRPRSTLGLSHGFLLGYLKKIDAYFPKDVNVIAVCPKGMGLSVRRLYQQSIDVNGAGINCSFAIEQDITGMATDYALGWAIALGSPATFQTTLQSEYLSDIVGERGILLGAVHGIAECLYRWFMKNGFSTEDAFINSAESITGPISQTISESGLLAVFQSLDNEKKEIFQNAYSLSYMPAFEILLEIYDEVFSGNEISSVIMAHERHKRFSMGKIDGTDMWKIGQKIRLNRGSFSTPIHPVTVGLYLATMMAQVDLLKQKGHPYSEIANESIIEAVDSLNPYMHDKGVSFMIDNCSITGRLGARKWAPRFDYIFSQQTLALIDDHRESDKSIFDSFLDNEIHAVLTTCMELRSR